MVIDFEKILDRINASVNPLVLRRHLASLTQYISLLLRIYDVCLNFNWTGITNNLFQIQVTNYMVPPFNVIPLKSYAFSRLSLLSFYAWLEGFFSDGSQLSSHSQIVTYIYIF